MVDCSRGIGEQFVPAQIDRLTPVAGGGFNVFSNFIKYRVFLKAYEGRSLRNLVEKFKEREVGK